MEDVDLTLKCIVVGNGAVGKTSLITRFVKGEYTDEYKKTIGTDFLETEFYSESADEEVTLHLWDTAGQEVFSTITRSYYRGSALCILAFSTVDRASFDAIKKWMSRVEEECGPIPMVIMQNKIDLLTDSSEVSLVDGDALAKELDLPIVRTCVKDERGVKELFDTLVSTYFDLKADQEALEVIKGRAIDEEEEDESKPETAGKKRRSRKEDIKDMKKSDSTLSRDKKRTVKSLAEGLDLTPEVKEKRKYDCSI
eukprot:gnl/Carplike_NY0171/2633_a3539_559.p1 GENE.gnl/Carplike_NY0171/2633_a3539_559~~gnl/Carplike_NY0171/2633_a3539_559.p1  ORF type:complete len:254 (-),score=87.09 gnl/Carplike_NY0171/2633_a3539_559:117-878(-)